MRGAAVPDLARFDDTRAALAFALNASQVVPPAAAMNRMLAAAATSDEKPRRKKRKGKPAMMVYSPGSAEALLQEEKDAARGARKRDPGNRPPPLVAADRAHQAGIILYHFGKLDLRHRIVLTGLLTTRQVPCDCRRPCCSGWAAVGQWRAAVHDTCLLLKQQADVVAPGRKGLGTQPVLRRLIVEDYYAQSSASLVDLSARAGVTTKTVALHRAWITEYLERIEGEAWGQVAALFDVYRITGPWNRI